MSQLEIGLLGPLTVRVGGHVAPVTTGRLRSLLAVLALSAGRPVSVDRIATALWDADTPASVRRTVQTYVTRLRGLLGPDSVGTAVGGYLLCADPAAVDALCLVARLDDASRTADRRAECRLLGEALALWRGAPLLDVPSESLRRTEVPRLVERYLSGVERRIDLAIQEGWSEELVAGLTELTGRHPLRESLWTRLIVTLSRCGHGDEALRRYAEFRDRLAEELGVDPSAELREIEADLRAGRGVRWTPPHRSHGAPQSAPRLLPAGIDAFAGRESQLAELDRRLDDGGSRPVLVHGLGGVGKTALAVHWGHRVTDRFPDGQLYVDLCGFGPTGEAAGPARALRELLCLLNGTADRLPGDLPALEAAYRDRLAGRRVLVILDNARTEEQVRPLLPPAPCLAVITSRRRPAGLSAVAHPVELGVLGAEESRQAVAQRIGRERVDAEPGAVDQIVARCGGLPLALAIAAARANLHPDFPLAALASELETWGALDTFASADPATDVRTVFSWSYGQLPPQCQALFRMLAHHPGPGFGAPAAASLAGVPVESVRPQLAQLAAAHLLTEQRPDRFSQHALLAAYADELGRSLDPQAERTAAHHRLLDHYLHTAVRAAALFDPHHDAERLAGPPAAVPAATLTDRPQAVAWLRAERVAILRLVERAAAAGLDGYAVRLAGAVAPFLYTSSYLRDLVTVLRIALTASARMGDRPWETRLQRDLGDAYAALGAHDAVNRR